jgi:hypothetical protein
MTIEELADAIARADAARRAAGGDVDPALMRTIVERLGENLAADEATVDVAEVLAAYDAAHDES